MHISDAELKLLEIVVPHINDLYPKVKEAINARIQDVLTPPAPTPAASAAPAAPSAPTQVIQARVKKSAPSTLTLDELVAAAVDCSLGEEDYAENRLRRRIIYHMGEDFLRATQGYFFYMRNPNGKTSIDDDEDNELVPVYGFDYQRRHFVIRNGININDTGDNDKLVLEVWNNGEVGGGEVLLDLRWSINTKYYPNRSFLQALHSYTVRTTEAA